MTGRTCTECGGKYYARHLCRRHYWRLMKSGAIGRRTWPGPDLVAEVIHLLAGSSPEVVADRLELTPAAIARAMRRHGRPDLAPQFERVRPSRAKAAS